MKKIIVILTILGILSAFFGTSFAANVRIEGRDLVVYGSPVEKQRDENVFASSVEPSEVPPEIAYALLHKNLPVYAPEEMKKSRLKKLNHRNFPIRLEKEKTWVEYFADEGKISKREKSSVKSNKDFVFEFFLRVLIGGMILVASIANAFSKSSKGEKLIIFYLTIIVIVVFSAIVGEVIGARIGALIGTFAGAIAGAIAGLFAGGFTGLFARVNTDEAIGAIATLFAGLITGLFTGLFTGGFVGKVGWQNAGVNDYLIFLGIACLLSFIISRIAKFAVDKIKVKKQVIPA